MRNKSLAKHPMVQVLIKLGTPHRKARRMVIDVLSRPIECNVLTYARHPSAFCLWANTKHPDAWAAAGLEQSLRGFNA